MSLTTSPLQPSPAALEPQNTTDGAANGSPFLAFLQAVKDFGFWGAIGLYFFYKAIPVTLGLVDHLARAYIDR